MSDRARDSRLTEGARRSLGRLKPRSLRPRVTLQSVEPAARFTRIHRSRCANGSLKSSRQNVPTALNLDIVPGNNIPEHCAHRKNKHEQISCFSFATQLLQFKQSHFPAQRDELIIYMINDPTPNRWRFSIGQSCDACCVIYSIRRKTGFQPNDFALHISSSKWEAFNKPSKTLSHQV